MGKFFDTDDLCLQCARKNREIDALKQRLHNIHLQATRRHRACGLKRYLLTDLEIIERLSASEEENA